MNQAMLSVLIEVQKIAQATKEIRGLDSTLSQAASAADASAKEIDQAGSVGGKGFAGGVSKGTQAAAGDLAKAGGAATATASEMGAAGAKGGKGFAAGVGAVKAAGVDLDAVAAGAKATATKMGVAGTQGGKGFASGADRGLAGVTGDLDRVSADARATAGQMGNAGDRGGAGFVAGVRSKLGAVDGAFGVAVTAAKSVGPRMASAGREAGRAFADKAGQAMDGLKEHAKTAALAAGAAGAAALGAGLTRAISLDAANDKLAAQLGLSARRSKVAGKVAGDLYAGAWGGSMEEVNTATGAVMSSIEGMSTAGSGRLKAITSRALDFAAAFDIDVQRAVASAGIVLQTGLAPNAKRAFDLITTASQRVPAELREDVLEASDEYAQFFAGLGYSGKESFAVLVDAAGRGRFALDKVGDAAKEFTIRSTDMSSASKDAYKAIGLDAKEMADMIVAGGGQARKASGQIIDGLLSIKNPSKQANAAIALFGAPLEDLNVSEIPAFLRSMKGTSKAMDGLAGGSKRMGDTLNDNANVRITAFKRNVTQGITQAVAKAIPVLEKAGGVIGGLAAPIKDVVDWFGRHKTALAAVTAILTPLIALWGVAKVVLIAQKVAVIALGVAMTVLRGIIIALSVASKAAAVAQLLLNAALMANPIGLVVLAIVAFVAGLVLAWKKSETFRTIVIAVWKAIKAAAVKLWGQIKESIVDPLRSAFEWVREAVGNVREWLVGAWATIRRRTSVAWQKVKAAVVDPLRSAWEWVRTAVGNVREWLVGAWATIRERTAVAWGKVKEAVMNPLRSAWEWLRTAVGNVREWLSGAWNTIRERASNAWQGVKERIIGPIRNAVEWVRDKIGALRSWLSDTWGRIGDRVGAFAGNLKDRIVGALKGAVNKVIGFVNSIIGAVNKIPGVDIGQVGKLATGGTVSRAGVEQAQALAHGGKVTRPMAIVGEQAPAHPEWVIPENPAYRGRALGLFAQLGDRLGVPGFALGGVLGKAKSALSGGASALGGLLSGGASAILGKLPNPADMLPDWLRGLGSRVIEDVTAWIKEKVKSLIPVVGGGGGGIGTGGTNTLARSLAAAFGLSITSGYRSPEHNAAVGGVPGSSHTKGSLANPGAHDFVPASSAALRAAMAMGAMWADMHDFGSGLHLHVSWFAKGGVFDKMGSPAPFVGSYKQGGTLPADGLYYGHRGEQVTPQGAQVREGPLVHIEHYEVHDAQHDEERLAEKVGFRLRAEGVV